MPDPTASVLQDFHDQLLSTYGPQHWWPGGTATEIVVGAILTQNTAWTNAARAIDALRRAELLTWKGLRDVCESDLAELIRPAGTYRVKASRLKVFVNFLWTQFGGSLEHMLSGELEVVRERLLTLHGIGHETADAILLYAGDRPTFVIDAYTRRVLRRHRLIQGREPYDEVQSLFHRSLPRIPEMFNEFHALFVAVGKQYCKRQAQCEGCPLASWPHDGSL